MWESIVLATSFGRRQLRKQFCASFAEARFHTALNLSVSWLAKRRLAGDGPPYVKLGGAVRYAEASLQQWTKGQQRTSTSAP
jgi:hypothetical protein